MAFIVKIWITKNLVVVTTIMYKVKYTLPPSALFLFLFQICIFLPMSQPLHNALTAVTVSRTPRCPAKNSGPPSPQPWLRVRRREGRHARAGEAEVATGASRMAMGKDSKNTDVLTALFPWEQPTPSPRRSLKPDAPCWCVSLRLTAQI